MKKGLFYLLAVVLLACGETKKTTNTTETDGEGHTSKEALPAPDMHSSENALDWSGTYRGVVPCADCEGIATTVSLMENGQFSRETTYLGKGNETFTSTGSFVWDADGRKVTLTETDGTTHKYQVGENILFHLDREGNRVTGELADHYRLMKQVPDPLVEGKKWRLVQLQDQKVALEGADTAPHLTLNAEDTRVFGSTGCNNFSGAYVLLAGNQLTFGKIAATMRACPDMELPTAFKKVLERTAQYALDNGVLHLKTDQGETLAQLEQVQE
ncbi:copper resistance protein NlpE N-terminal domain-containing protein [Maribacter sp. 2307ULW6-5]|uniref:copper resistance protein NlpE N-terminal domain-containing protein n=1 Tax=Maribacter sp. 2307ULW6-5 TaxID=3386275 RepID=UPI0039BCF78D